MRNIRGQDVADVVIKDELDGLGVDVFVPETKKEIVMAEAFDAFSLFVLHDEREKCQAIIDKHVGQTVGQLQGGTDEYEIYRVTVMTEDDDDATSTTTSPSSLSAAQELLQAFYESWQGKRYVPILTIDKLKQYMLGMCERRSRTRDGDSTRYAKLGNLMFILSFGPTDGQVRHIDSMIPNVQICLYMSAECPSTTIYSLEGPAITNSDELLGYWEDIGLIIPQLVKDIFADHAASKLSERWYTKYFAFWDSIDATLKCFGKLYQPVSSKLGLVTDPGTTLIAGGNEVHSGPPTTVPRMFAFAIGIPDGGPDHHGVYDEDAVGGNEDNNGEIQYNPVLLHVDLTCILASIMEWEYSHRHEEHRTAKVFLIEMILTLGSEYTHETYARLLGDDRSSLRDWLGRVVSSFTDRDKLNALVCEAIESETILPNPDIQHNRRKPKKKKIRKVRAELIAM
jgi:hypothetical protein